MRMRSSGTRPRLSQRSESRSNVGVVGLLLPIREIPWPAQNTGVLVAERTRGRQGQGGSRPLDALAVAPSREQPAGAAERQPDAAVAGAGARVAGGERA